MTLLIFSDLHIHGVDDPLYRALLAELRTLAETVSRERSQGSSAPLSPERFRVIFAGDIFDFFVGNKPVFRDRYQEFLQTTHNLCSLGVRIDYIEGNHDFHLRSVFADFPRWTTHSQELHFECAGKKFYVAHGDLADPSDWGYRSLRWVLRSQAIQILVSRLKGKTLDALGSRLSKMSRDRRAPVSENLEKTRQAFRNHAADQLAKGADFVVMGHCHDLDEKSFLIGDRSGHYMNVGYPRKHGSYVRWSAGEDRLSRSPLKVHSSK